MWVVACMVLLALGQTQGQLRLDPLVDTKQGLIRGLRAEDGDYAMFLGIPYAKVDAANPFGASTPHPKFDNIFEAYDDSAVCPQVNEFSNTIEGTLDCLHLNVYVPNKASTRTKLPVLVWIYGGGFSIGFAGRYLYGPKFLVRHDVILVTLNYRVGPYGFMCLDTPEVPGNQGLKDQLLALRWVKENIASFGGDVNKVTLMGESAGAASVEFQLMSKQERLFDKVILQSGSALSFWAITEADSTAPLKLADRLGFATEDTSEALKFLANTDPSIVIAATAESSVNFKVCVEKEFDGVESILTEHPVNADVPKVKTIPVLSGFNNNEYLAFSFNKPPEYYKNLNIFRDTLQTIYNYDEDFQQMEDIMRHFYLGDEEVSHETRGNVTDYESDLYFTFPGQLSMEKFLDNGAENVYQYLFSYEGARNFVKVKNNITASGAAHADEIGYLFDLSYDKNTPSVEDQKVIDVITTLWTNFVKFGEPTPEQTDLLPIKWTPITKNVYTYLNIDRDLTLGKRPFHDRLAFWKLFYKTNMQKLKAYKED